MAQHDFTVEHYAPRARDYVLSLIHAAGPDLDQIAALVASRRPGRVLDLGTGGGHAAYATAPHAGTVVATDVTTTMLASVAAEAASRNLRNITTRQAAAEALPFDDASFDGVLCRLSAHHWPDWEAGLREARRVLAPDGFAIFTDTIAPACAWLDTHLQAMEILRDPSHIRNYTVAQWTAALSRAGFRIVELSQRRRRIDFASWIARTRTPDLRRDAILSLQREAPALVRTHFAIAADGSFDLEGATFVLEPA